ncbi:Pde9a [Symbiodinium sp. CCMP2592]|nr:Pde9a [Symbiodinium sp. CCMP2592]
MLEQPEELAGTEVGGGEYTPSDLHLPNLLPYLSVQELLSWRLLSRRTRSPEVLIQHVAEMGSMDRPEAITAFAEKVKMFCDNPAASFAAALQGDAQLYDSAFQNSAKQQKLYECQSWCMALASNERAHFAEVHIRRIVGKNLESLLWHHRSADASVAKAASLLVFNYASDALPFVQQRIAEVMLDLIEDFVESNIPANLVESQKCIRTLEKVLRSLSKPQRQRAVSLMVKLVMDPHVPKQAVIWQLKMLWLADDNPRQTYAQAHQQLQIVAKSDTAALKNDLLILLNSC